MLRHTAEHSLVAFHGLATGELTLQLYIRLLGAGEHKQSTRVHVETMSGAYNSKLKIQNSKLFHAA
jgi:hypothetical protein